MEITFNGCLKNKAQYLNQQDMFSYFVLRRKSEIGDVCT